MENRPRVLHFITHLDTGGAETFLYNLIRYTRDRVDHAVISLKGKGKTAQRIEALGIPVDALHLGLRLPSITAFKSLAPFGGQSFIVQTWLYHADFLGGMYGRLRGVPVIWSIRHRSPREVHLKTRPITFLTATISSFVPDVIVANSREGIDLHVKAGYAKHKFRYIPNGFATDVFRPMEEVRTEVRRELGIAEDAFVIGMVGRFILINKDYPTLLEAFGRFLSRHRQAVLLLVGPGHTVDNAWWVELITRHGLAPEIGKGIRPLGARSDIPRLLNAMDVFTLSSKSEGFPNVVGEAMACAVPVVTSDVSEARELVGNDSLLFAPGDVQTLLERWEMLLRMGEANRKSLGQNLRKRISTHYEIKDIANRYVELYRSLAR